ncbi:SH3 domain-containing protein [Marinibactrum halimedae]|uniref:SH3b domain-containing protein n=1 Tax=Marinibactrum halimedae TaxID=1444977 RepID=A0AA37T2W2_9GAMM|nr:SH3 domain-containing protein [Marinibactrum halimedae]MCD9457427.1 SH3 domain-containing protein [Marinibactrum halimedae]GLS25523.1 hypothetical protein GCM10007877_12370 [Marinibactrum halimedae]
MKLARLLFSIVICFTSFHYAHGEAKSSGVKLEVIDPFIEIHTGPGVGYPVFYTVEQGEMVEVLTRRTGWYELKIANQQTGWAKASQIARTLLPTGEPVDLPTISYGDYLTNKFRTGFRAGQFSGDDLNNIDFFSLSAGYQVLSWLGIEAEAGKLYDTNIRGDFYGANIVFEPFSRYRLSPILLLGGGNIEFDSQPELTPIDFGEESYYNIGLGANYYLGRNFVLQAGYSSYVINSENEEELERWNLGFNAFF